MEIDGGPSLVESPERNAERLNHFIRAGVSFIKDHNFPAAKRFFKNKQFAESLGISMAPARVSSIDEKDKGDKEKCLEAIELFARNNWYKDRDRVLELSNILVTPYISSNQELPDIIDWNICLVYAEEWLHALQALNGKSLTGESSHEKDVAVYLYALGIPLSKEFLMRYDRLEAVKKYQEKIDAQRKNGV